LRVELRCDSSAPGHARRAVGELEALDPVRDDAILLVSELVATAVGNGSPNGPATVELTATEVPQGVQFVVETDRAGRGPEPAAMVTWLVGALAQRWGVHRRDGTAKLWAELAV